MGLNLHAGVSFIFHRFHSYKEFKDKKCLMLGVQEMDVQGYDVYCALCSMGFELPSFVHELSRHEMNEHFDSYKFFEWLGFEDIESLDVSDYEGATIIADLNEPVADELKSQYDIIFDGGTLEHVFNVHQAMKNIGDMLKKEGYVIHDVPAHNYSNHGFYMFSPTFFQDYYAANKYRVEELYLFNHVANDCSSEYRSVDCRLIDPMHFYSNVYSRRCDEVSLLICVAKKLSNSTEGHIPIQGLYNKIFSDEKKIEETIMRSSSRFNKIAIYGTGPIACQLYDGMKQKGKEVCLVEGENGRIPPSGYRIMNFQDCLGWAECLIIASFRYADLIEKRISGELKNKSISIINMLDI